MNLAYSDLTRRLVETLPELEPAFAEEQAGWEEEEGPPHIAYGNLLTPLLEELLVSQGNAPLLSRAFSLLEELSSSDDPLVQEVVTDTICEYIVDRPALYFPAKRFMGEKTAELCTRTEVH